MIRDDTKQWPEPALVVHAKSDDGIPGKIERPLSFRDRYSLLTSDSRRKAILSNGMRFVVCFSIPESSTLLIAANSPVVQDRAGD